MQTQLEIREQSPLQGRSLWDLTLTGIRHRVLRSGVTVAVMAVAMVFLINVAGGDLLTQSAVKYADRELRGLRAPMAYLGYVTRQPTLADFVSELASGDLVVEVRSDFLPLSGPSSETLDGFVSLAGQAALYVDFLRQLPGSGASGLAGPGFGLDDLNRWQDGAELDAFLREVDQHHLRNLPGGVDSFRQFLKEWAVAEPILTLAWKRRLAAAARVADVFPARALLENLARDTEPTLALLVESGFASARQFGPVLAESMRWQLKAEAMERRLLERHFVQAVAGVRQIKPSQVTHRDLWELLTTQTGTVSLERELVRRGGPGLEAGSEVGLMQLAGERVRVMDLEELLSQSSAAVAVPGWRRILLVGISLLVCVVGVTNAMLMAVTERFREIATLKCLGALDRTIAVVFLSEAVASGLAGALLGIPAGLLLAVLRLWADLHIVLWPSLPWYSIAGLAIGSLILGAVLAALAAVYPALKAARLAPMEAMRVE